MVQNGFLARAAGALALAVAIGLPGPEQARAQSDLDAFAIGSTADDRRRANLVSRQKTLVERMAVQACFITMRVDTEEDIRQLAEARALFMRTQAALRDGNALIGLDAETNGRIKRRLAEVDRLFERYAAASEPFDTVAGDHAERLGELVLQTGALFNAIDRVAGLVDRQYVERAFSVPQITALRYAGLQRHLSQRKLKEACLIAAGVNAEPNRIRLADGLDLFLARQAALRDGEPLVGLPAAADPRVMEKLDEADAIWAGFRPILERAAAGGALTDADLAALEGNSTDILVALNDLVYLMEGVEGGV